MRTSAGRSVQVAAQHRHGVRERAQPEVAVESAVEVGAVRTVEGPAAPVVARVEYPLPGRTSQVRTRLWVIMETA
ncbi:hypothetical protein SAVIM40S_00349 [Streptomyces avidinii]|uniref:Uncharacterized protein n=1 Tax=Streptomyces avidinii TaxID=1895 RepID=A0ABS4L7F7_STRAV|nr:hypothetical protein [Streptomyces avidinii]